MKRWHMAFAHSYELRRRLNPYVLFLGLLAWGALSLCGYSTSQRMFVSDQAIIEAAMRHAMFRVTSPDGVPHAGIEQFRAANPDCCEFVAGDTEGTRPSPLAYLLGDEWRVVRVRYQVRFRDAPGALRAGQATEYLMMSRDGKVVWSH